MSREHEGRRAEADEGEPGAAAIGKHSRVASRYPALAQTLGDRGGEPTIHDAATAAVEHKGGGAAVDPGVAARVGAHLGADFSDVRVHGDPLSREATAAMGARAFAYGGDVFLGPGESGGDLGLMAHELTHVAQQGAAGQRLPQRAVQVGDANSPAEHEADQVAAAVTGGGGRPAALLVDQAPVGPGQMLKSQFMEQLQAQVTAAADAELGPIYSAIGCPYIEQYFGRYAGQPASAGEALLRRFAPGARAAGSAADLIPAVVARVREGVRQWRDTGEPPADLAAMAPQGGGGAGAAPAQAQALRAPDGGETLASLEAELGPGQPLDGATASRMSDALGIEVSSARIHTGPVAARKAADAGALAFAVGANVVMGAGAPGAGTLEGDALLAHELVHTAQQRDAAADPAARRAPIGGEASAAEDHADAAAAGALAQLHGEKGGLARLADKLGGAFRTGLQLQRCPDRPRVPQGGGSGLNAYADPRRAEFDPSRITDAQLEATDEYRLLMNPAEVWQTRDHVTADEARLACRLVLRVLRTGGTVAWPADAGTYVTQAREQLGSVHQAEGMNNSLHWTGQAPGLTNTEFGRWLLSGGPEPSAATGDMNCWELVMFSAFRAGFTTKPRLQALYTQFATDIAADIAAGVTAFETAVRRGPEQVYAPGDPDSPRPVAGDLVIFGTIANHAAVATGNYPGGKVEVMSLWTQNSRQVVRTTIEDLGSTGPYRFFSPHW